MRIDLQRGRFLRVVDGAGSTLTAHAGSVWVTEEDSPRDVVLRAGESLRLRRRGVALVEAFSDAAISFDA
jgi:Protein of unknown function (DUF2917)